MVEFTNTSITIRGAEGFKYVAIRNATTSTANGTITGSGTSIGGLAVSGITLVPGDAANYGTGQHDIDGITITAPANCTMQVFGSIINPIT